MIWYYIARILPGLAFLLAFVQVVYIHSAWALLPGIGALLLCWKGLPK